MTRAMSCALSRDRRGATLAEFAVVLPVMLLLIMGLCDLSYRGYVQAMLSGAMQKAGRDATLQGNETETVGSDIDLKVMSSIWSVARGAKYKSSRKSYAQFGHVAPEPFVDSNNNDRFDKATECFTDINNNKTWDEDPGAKGQGGASDVVVYKMEVTYDRIFPLAGLMGWPQEQKLSATTILKNQPYKGQSAYTPEPICPPKS